MSGFALLWSKILDSSLWVQETKETRLVWITLLAMKDSNGIIQASVVGLADRAKVSVSECRDALAVLLAPDPNDSSGVDEGRRIKSVPGGWVIVNHDTYRFSTAARREFWRAQKARYRERAKKTKPLPGETAAIVAMANGDEAGADRITTESLPPGAVGGLQGVSFRPQSK